MINPKEKPQKRQPGLKSRRSSIPENFKIRRSHPLAQILEEAATHEVESDGYPQVPVATHIPTPSTTLATHLPTPSTQQLPTKLKPVATHRVEGKRRIDERQISMRLNVDLVKKINNFCSELGITAKEFWETLATHAVEPGNPVATHAFSQLVGRWVAHDDMMMFKTRDDIIMRYQEMTGLKWNRRDDRDGVQYNNIDQRLLDIGFIQTVANKLKGNTAKIPIKSFAYFKTEIESLIQQQRDKVLPELLDDYHRYVLSTWEKRIRPLRDQKWSKL
jgi:hypothetical protein